MSDIPVSTVVRVTISTAPTFPTRKGFGTLNIIGPSDVISVAERCRVYANIEGVEADFDISTEEWKAANTYFAQNPAPQQLIISRRAASAQAAVLRSGGNPEVDIPALNLIVDGKLKLTINGTTAEATAIDFSAADDMDDIVAAIQTKVRAANVAPGFASALVTFVDGRYYVTSGTTGAASTISFALAASATGTDLGPLLELTEGEGTKSNGVDTETPVQAAVAAQNANSDWYGLAYTNEVRDTPDMEDVSDWVQSRVKVLGLDSDDRDIIDSQNTNNLASALLAKAARRTMVCLNYLPDEYLAVSALSRAFIVNFSTANSTITLKFKQMPGITPYPLSLTEKATLDARQANAYYTVGGNPMFGEGYVSAKGIFFDEVHGIDWLQNAIETNVFGKLYTDTTKTPMTDPGVASLQQKVEQALDEGVKNGLLAPGYDRNDEYLQKGYLTSTIPMREWKQTGQHETRKGPPITFVCLGAGAIHGIEINGTFQR